MSEVTPHNAEVVERAVTINVLMLDARAVTLTVFDQIPFDPDITDAWGKVLRNREWFVIGTNADNKLVRTDAPVAGGPAIAWANAMYVDTSDPIVIAKRDAQIDRLERLASWTDEVAAQAERRLRWLQWLDQLPQVYVGASGATRKMKSNE